MVNIIYGLPGTGKTTTLINIVNSLLKEGYDINDICVNTFRRSMANEFIERSKKLIGKRKPRYWSTLHSICYSLIGDKEIKVADHRDISSFFRNEMGLDYKYKDKEDENINPERELANALMDIYHIVVNTTCDKDMTNWREIVTDCGNTNLLLVPDEKLEEFVDLWNEYKKRNGLIDFNDMLLTVYEYGLSPETPVLISDEMQDYTRLQYEIYKNWKKDADIVYIAGDEFQAIYIFWGSSPEFILREMENGKVNILPRSYRFGKEIWNYATKVITYKDIPKIECAGESEKVITIDSYSFPGILADEYAYSDSILILVRAGYIGAALIKELTLNGIPYSGIGGWTENQIKIYNGIVSLRERGIIDYQTSKLIVNLFSADKLLVKKSRFNKRITKDNIYKIFKPSVAYALLNGENPLEESRASPTFKDKVYGMIDTMKKLSLTDIYKVKVMTIHASKGLQAETVFLLNDISNKVKQSLENRKLRENEERTFFVGCTRARKKLYIVDGYMIDKYDYGYTYPLPSTN